MPETPARSLLLTVALSLSLPCAIPAQEPLPRIVLSGRVVDVLGAGVPIADVRVLDLDDGKLLSRTTSDAEGLFRVRLPERTAYLVRGAADGFATCSLAMTAIGGELTLVRGFTLRGRMLGPDGEPQAGVPVAAISVEEFGTEPEPVRTVTDEHGRFELPRTAIGLQQVFARRLDGPLLYAMPRVLGDAELELLPPVTPLRVPGGLLPTPVVADAPAPRPAPTDGEQAPIVRPQLPFAVRVVDPDDAPIPELLVAAMIEGRHAFQLARCDRDGIARFPEPLPFGIRVVVTCRDPRWVIDRPRHLTTQHLPHPTGNCMVIAGEQTPIVLAEPANSVTVTVLGPDGMPAPDVVVQLERQEMAQPTFAPVDAAVTDIEGKCVFRGLHPRLANLRARVGGASGFAVGDEFTIEAGHRALAQTLQLTPATVVYGTVFDAKGDTRAVTDVSLACTHFHLYQQTHTDIDGRYRLVGPAGHTATLNGLRLVPNRPRHGATQQLELRDTTPVEQDLHLKPY